VPKKLNSEYLVLLTAVYDVRGELRLLAEAAGFASDRQAKQKLLELADRLTTAMKVRKRSPNAVRAA
jgi:DNA phosphorothioation-dependent restriction protein DptG